MKRFLATIVVNGRKVEVSKPDWSFDELRQLAGMPNADAVIFKHPVIPEHRQEGILSHHQSVIVKDGTVINVAATTSA